MIIREQLLQPPLLEKPFRHVLHGAEIFEPQLLQRLYREFPEASHTGYGKISHLKLTPLWQQFVDYLHSSEYRALLEERMQTSFRGGTVELGLRRYSAISEGGVHTDASYKRVTHLIYWNETWPDSCGRLRLLNSNNLEDVATEVTPTLGNGVVFLVGDKSFHGFRPYAGERRMLQINLTSRGWLRRTLGL